MNSILNGMTFKRFSKPSAAAIRADDLAAERRQIRELGILTAAPLMHPAEGFTDGAGMRAKFYDSLPWK